MNNIEICYPNYSKKAITFTLDDGNLLYDGKMLEILSPYGIKGSFNLPGCDLVKHTREEYRALYNGSEVANHCKMHPYCLDEGTEYSFSSEPFDIAAAKEDKLYLHPTVPGLYYIHRPRGWRLVAREDTYAGLVDIGKREIEEVFGIGSVKGFVWPFGEQSSEAVHKHLRDSGYASVRRTGCTEDKYNFDVPEDPMRWSYNANHLNLLPLAAKFAATPDDGKLKMFSFGVHSIDFERAERWEDVRTFAAMYGNRPLEYWYATVGEIFDYIGATKCLDMSDGYLTNNADTTVYIKISDRCIALAPSTRIKI